VSFPRKRESRNELIWIPNQVGNDIRTVVENNTKNFVISTEAKRKEKSLKDEHGEGILRLLAQNDNKRN